ncbi:hypothetical protein EV424DRAFT_1420752 [Suillus variegatus]|nr:hypothetical protein EV424DRAFT_1420752 [Suillus variegatus]
MSGLEESLYALDWNNNISVAIITLVSYDYMLQFEKEVTSSVYHRRVLMIILLQVTFVWQRQRSIMTYMYLVVRYFGISIAMTCACWGGLFYIPETPYVTISFHS